MHGDAGDDADTKDGEDDGHEAVLGVGAVAAP
jgi:hypothetical protein